MLGSAHPNVVLVKKSLRNARAARPGAKRDGRPLADAFLLDGLPPGVSC